MALPSLITTDLWPDYKNSSIGPFPKIIQVTQEADSFTNEAIGSLTQEKVAQSFLALDGRLSSIDVMLLKVQFPTDSVTFQLCEDNADQPGTVIATGTSIPNTRLSTTKVLRRTIFLQPVTLVVGSKYWIVIGRSGSLNSTNYYTLGTATFNPYTDGKAMKFSSGVWSDLTSVDGIFKVNFRVEGRYQVAIDKTNNKVRMLKSVDAGSTWSEMDATNAPAIISTATLKTVTAQAVNRLIHVFTVTSATRFDVQKFDTDTDTWATQEDGDISTTITANVSAVAALFGCYRTTRSSIQNVVVYNGLAETVMGNARRRIKLSRGPTYQTTEFDVVGSANTPDITLPGLAVDYDFRAALMDADDVVHVFWTQSDDSNLHHRAWLVNNTFATANLMGSTPAVTSNTAAYPLGLPANYYRSDEWRIAVPYVDGGTIKVARVAAASASTASSWASTTAVTATIEVTSSNPCALVADNEQGGKLFLVFIKSDGKVYYTHDQASDVWVAEQELHPGTKTVAGISAGVLLNAIGIVYQDNAPTPDDLKFDSLDVFYVRADLSIGSYSVEHDLGTNEQRDYLIMVDVEELASTSYRAQSYVRETETDAWQLLNGGGSDAVETSMVMQLQGKFRYVKIDVVTTGDVFESGVVGY